MYTCRIVYTLTTGECDGHPSVPRISLTLSTKYADSLQTKHFGNRLGMMDNTI